jgi:DNA mismatch repair protein MutL
MPDIRQLPTSVVNKIAAGEVIERPASVVKELMENSVDAGATRIDVVIEQGGGELVRVADNGCGIAGEQICLAVASHATSKISDADDLFRVRTLGFRGEALASIAEVSHLRLRSRTAQSDAGVELEVVGGAATGPAPCGCPIGTSVEVRKLFFNTPVRRKFLRTTQTEMGHVSEAFTRIALAHPRVHFTLVHNDRPLYELPPVESWRERIATFFGGELGDGLIAVESQDGDVRLSGYVADPNFSRGNNRMQYLFLNGRHIRDRSLQHALGEAYRGLLLTGRFPVAFLRLEMPPDLVDVNVHPAKLEVRFQEGGRIYSQMLGALRKKFLSTDLTAKVQPAAISADQDPAAAHDATQTQRHRRELVDWAKGQLPGDDEDAAGDSPAQSPLPLRYDHGHNERVDFTRMHFTSSPGGVSAFKPFPGGVTPRLATPSHEGPSLATAPHETAAAQPAPWKQAPAAAATALQIHNRYLITEDDAGVVVIDQHALHERILYEQLREKVLAGAMEAQRLLVPEPVALTAAEAAAALDAKELLAQLGIQIEPFGGDTVLVSSYPAMLANISPAELLRQVVEQLLTGGKSPERRDLLDSLLHMISCKAAIKAGDRLSPEEVHALIQHRDLCQDAHHCPHGRPTALVFTREELDRRFKRT